MTDSEDDYVLLSDDNDDSALRWPRRKRSRVPVASASRLNIGTLNEEQYNDTVQKIKKLRGKQTLSKKELLDIVALQAYFRHEHHKKIKKGGNYGKLQAREKVRCALLRSGQLVSKTWTDFCTNGTVTVNMNQGNRNPKKKSIPNTKKFNVALRQFVCARCASGERTVVQDVIDFCQERNFCTFEGLTKDAMHKNVQRMLIRRGYRRGRPSQKGFYREREENLIKRDVYIQATRNLREAGHRFVYMDESYIHHHYTSHKDSIFHPDDSFVPTRYGGKGHRYCFIAAIIDADGSVDPSTRSEDQEAALLLDTVDIFHGGKRIKAQPKDYHAMFNHDYFKKWMETLLNVLDARNVKNAVIVMDNAKYHKVKSAVPNRRSKKTALEDACKRYGLVYDENSTKKTLWAVLGPYIEKHVDYDIVAMAKARGHQVLFTPPHYSDLQPIETVWAIVKSEVGRQYTNKTTFPEVKARLETAFKKLSSGAVAGCIRKSNRILDQLWQQSQAADEHSPDSSDADSSSGSDDPLDDLEAARAILQNVHL